LAETIAVPAGSKAITAESSNDKNIFLHFLLLLISFILFAIKLQQAADIFSKSDNFFFNFSIEQQGAQ
jgi:hypothetical protein